ncbi:MAG: hypothetical protein M1814_000490 [Vezdaea aestivalis]|nr:MAG: hypothetical protein M1814_000490 [Vezdaea aestivalis]
MGISASIEVANQLTQFAEGGRTLSDVLRDPEILASWESKYGALPKEAQKYFSKKRRSTEQEQLLSTIKNIQSSHLGISKYFRPSFDSWKKPDGFSVRGFANCEDPLARIYLELKGIADRRASDPIRERIYAVSLYKLYTSLARSAQGKLEPHKEGMIQRICDSSFCCDSRENVSQWIEKYWGFGRKMDAIAQENGGYGALMVIPAPLLTPSSWHKKVSDAILEEVNAHFISIEVDKVARSVGAHQVAERILQFISASFNHPDAMTQRSLLFNGANVAPPYQVTTESPLTYAVNPAHQWDGRQFSSLAIGIQLTNVKGTLQFRLLKEARHKSETTVLMFRRLHHTASQVEQEASVQSRIKIKRKCLLLTPSQYPMIRLIV